MIGILLDFAQLERETIRDRLVMGKTKRIEEGLPLVTAKGRTFGYDVIDTKLFVNKEEAEHLQLIYDLFEETQSILQEQKRMKELGHKVFNRQRYKSLLTNDIYIGSYADKVHTKRVHEAIIKEEQFYRVQQIFKGVEELPNINQESQSLLSRASCLWKMRSASFSCLQNDHLQR